MSEPGAYRLALVNEGTHTVTQHGQDAIIRPGGVYLLTPGVVDHFDRSPGSRSAIVDFIVSACALEHGPHDTALRPMDATHHQPDPRSIWGIDLPLSLADTLKPTCVDAIASITNSYWKSPYQHHRANLKLALLLDTIIQHYRPAESVSRQELEPVAMARELIAERLPDIPNAKALAAALHLSPDHLARIFKQTLGESAAAYLRRRRREKTAELLLTTSLPIASIATMVGYRNHMTLAHAWAKHYDLAPHVWRKQQNA